MRTKSLMSVAGSALFLLHNAHALGPEIAPEKTETGAEFPAELDAYVEGLLAEWEIPGAGLAVVKDGNVVVARGYGVRELGKKDAVDADTIFDVASLTKSFTAAAIAVLVDEKKLSWDTPVREYLPGLRPKDPYIAANLTLRDLLSHKVGSRHNAALYRGHLTRQQALGVFSRLDQSGPFRTRWVYSNLGYVVAGEVAASVSGGSWEALVTDRLLKPLKMTRTTARYEIAPAMRNHATGHVVVDGVQRPAPRGSERLSNAAAGAIHSSIRDLAKWLVFQLGEGSVGSSQLISSDAMAEMHAPQIVGSPPREYRQSRQIRHFAGYGLGWQVSDYRGRPLLWHTGSGDGQYAYMALLPDEEFGVAFVINTWRVPVSFNGAVISRIMDFYLGVPSRDYSEEFRSSMRRGEEKDAEREAELLSARLGPAEFDAPLSAYVGHYRDTLDLDIHVALKGDAFTFQYAGGDVALLERWRGDIFRLRWPNAFAQGDADFVAFKTYPLGNVVGLRTELLRDEIEAERIDEPSPAPPK